MAEKIDDRQMRHRAQLTQSALGINQELDNIVAGVDYELTPIYKLSPSAVPDRVLHISASNTVNPNTSVNRSAGAILGKTVSFAGGTITLPAASGGNITFSSGSPMLLTIASGNYIKALVSLDSTGSIVLTLGTAAASQAAALVPSASSYSVDLGYIVIYNNAGVIQNLDNTKIFQYNKEVTPPQMYSLAPLGAQLLDGGLWGWTESSGTLTRSGTAYVRIPGLPDAANSFAAGSNVITVGQALWVEANLTGLSGTVTATVSNINAVPQRPGVLIIASRDSAGNGIMVGNYRILNGSSVRLGFVGLGSVTSVTFTGDGTVFSSTPSTAVTTTGTLNASLNTQGQRTFLAGPIIGANATPTFRTISPTDVPTLNQSTTGTAANVTGIVAIGNGGTGQTNAQAAINVLAGSVTNGYYLRGNGSNVVMAQPSFGDISGTLGIGQGGTGQTSANNALNALLPSQSGQNGKALVTNGSNTAWQSVAKASLLSFGSAITTGAAIVYAGATWQWTGLSVSDNSTGAGQAVFISVRNTVDPGYVSYDVSQIGWALYGGDNGYYLRIRRTADNDERCVSTYSYTQPPSFISGWFNTLATPSTYTIEILICGASGYVVPQYMQAFSVLL